MDKKKKIFIFAFVMGVISTAFVIPLLSALGAPSFDVVLTVLFGEGNIWASVFSIILILLITVGAGKAIKSYT
ncbi:hypothetical protein [Psychrobacillus sp. NPDC093180]|uniref:hypothetical protein n=1 Tax=Psychrobacillus sp. NPDC093180 TaxID=3364489 RepID=UPI003811046F